MLREFTAAACAGATALLGLVVAAHAQAIGDPSSGAMVFQQQCSMCHSNRNGCEERRRSGPERHYRPQGRKLPRFRLQSAEQEFRGALGRHVSDPVLEVPEIVLGRDEDVLRWVIGAEGYRRRHRLLGTVRHRRKEEAIASTKTNGWLPQSGSPGRVGTYAMREVGFGPFEGSRRANGLLLNLLWLVLPADATRLAEEPIAALDLRRRRDSRRGNLGETSPDEALNDWRCVSGIAEWQAHEVHIKRIVRVDLH